MKEFIPLLIDLFQFLLLHDSVPVIQNRQHLIRHVLQSWIRIPIQISHHPRRCKICIQILRHNVRKLLRISKAKHDVIKLYALWRFWFHCYSPFRTLDTCLIIFSRLYITMHKFYSIKYTLSLVFPDEFIRFNSSAFFNNLLAVFV